MVQLHGSEIVARSDANFAEAFRILARSIDGGEIRDVGGIAVVATGLPVAAFNVAFITRPLASPAAQLQDAVSYFKARDLPFVIRFFGRVEPAAEEAARSLGLSPAESEPGMALLNEIPCPPPLDALTIVVARDQRTLDHHAAVLASGFGMPLELTRALMPARALHALDVELYVGYIDGEPVTTSALIYTHGVAGIYNVATIDAHRKKGLGEAMTWHGVRRGRELGCLFSSLQASDMGKPIYERMGYRVVTTYPTFTP